ncbi:DUF1877 domain-containing protein [Fusobacterium polymorphum]|jgi:hypothetical protein|uniref:DUF1877 domain-containing protein n=1 Tax=Fusobacterium nucleatum subsp. polymorphum TaxID=76857 RepID=A0A2C6BY53_FUSNP|nr:DUF1877 family protein [Fusobacterium polymorphum]PHI10598.1 DUF1877 domain-containing protein [Fusobacterium polymorphum]
MGMDIYYHAIENEDVAIFKKRKSTFYDMYEKYENTQHLTIRLYTARKFYQVYYKYKTLEEEDLQGKIKRNLLAETLIGQTKLSCPPKDIYSYCTSAKKVKRIAIFLNKITSKDLYKIFIRFREEKIKGSDEEFFISLNLKSNNNFIYTTLGKEYWTFEAIADIFQELKDFYNKVEENDMGVYIYIS